MTGAHLGNTCVLTHAHHGDLSPTVSMYLGRRALEHLDSHCRLTWALIIASLLMVSMGALQHPAKLSLANYLAGVKVLQIVNKKK
jgi:hypothetical protein